MDNPALTEYPYYYSAIFKRLTNDHPNIEIYHQHSASEIDFAVQLEYAPLLISSFHLLLLAMSLNPDYVLFHTNTKTQFCRFPAVIKATCKSEILEIETLISTILTFKRTSN